MRQPVTDNVLQQEGDGFERQHYLELDPERAFDAHGRGIAMAHMTGLEQMRYLGKGNTVEVTVAACSTG